MMFLMGVKGCHECLKRVICTLKNSKDNLVEKPRTFKKIETPRMVKGMPVPTEVKVTSYCADFNLERKRT